MKKIIMAGLMVLALAGCNIRIYESNGLRFICVDYPQGTSCRLAPGQ